MNKQRHRLNRKTSIPKSTRVRTYIWMERWTYRWSNREKNEDNYYKSAPVRTNFQQWGVHYGNMTPTNTNSDTQTIIQRTTSGGIDNVTPNQVGSGTNQGTSGDNWRNARGRNQKNRGDNQNLSKIIAVTLQEGMRVLKYWHFQLKEGKSPSPPSSRNQ